MRIIDADVLKKEYLDKFWKACAEDKDFDAIGTMTKIIDEAPTVESPKWIPVTFRPMDEEEYEEYRKEFGEIPIEHRKMFSCPMPEDDQEILVCTQWRGVSLDRCEIDEYGYALEEHGDWDGVMAWMPLPEPYKSESEEV